MTALIALSLIFLFSDVIYSAKLEGKIFPSFLKHFSLQVAQQVMTVVDFGSHFLKGFAQFSSLNLSSKEV